MVFQDNYDSFNLFESQYTHRNVQLTSKFKLSSQISSITCFLKSPEIGWKTVFFFFHLSSPLDGLTFLLQPSLFFRYMFVGKWAFQRLTNYSFISAVYEVSLLFLLHFHHYQHHHHLSLSNFHCEFNKYDLWSCANLI